MLAMNLPENSSCRRVGSQGHAKLGTLDPRLRWEHVSLIMFTTRLLMSVLPPCIGRPILGTRVRLDWHVVCYISLSVVSLGIDPVQLCGCVLAQCRHCPASFSDFFGCVRLYP